MWIDQVNKELSKRNLKLHQNSINNRRTYNKTIIECASTFTSTIYKLVDINYDRRYKGLLLLIELVREREEGK